MLRDIEYFYSTMCVLKEYNSANVQIKNVEFFLMCWLNGLVGDDQECQFSSKEGAFYIYHLYRLFKHDFLYQGEIYRGVVINEYKSLKTNYIASFTSNIEVAKEFAKPYQEGQRGYLFTENANNAFDFSNFLRSVNQKTACVDLQIVIEERVSEEEKLAYFLLDEVQEIRSPLVSSVIPAPA